MVTFGQGDHGITLFISARETYASHIVLMKILTYGSVQEKVSNLKIKLRIVFIIWIIIEI